MSEPSMDYLSSLPTELLYRIFENLDQQVIILSLSHVCKRMDIVINSYFERIDQKLNFNHITKSDFVRVCHFIQPENIAALTLSDQNTTPGQISLFLSYFSIERFTRLRSLTLLNIEDKHLQLILKHIVTCSLISLSIQEKKSSQRSTTTNTLLSMILKQPDLQELTLTLRRDVPYQIKPLTSSTVQHLTLYHYNIDDLPIISHHFSSLQTLTIKNRDLDLYLPSTSPMLLNLIPMYQLTSLIIEKPFIDMNNMASILSNTPSLTYLQLNGRTNQIDFPWEQFIQTKLPLLNQFKFSFYAQADAALINSLIDSFRTPFWLEIKKWFVNCDQYKYLRDIYTNYFYDIHLYTIPVCHDFSEYYPDLYKITYTTSIELNENVSIMDNVRTVAINAKTKMDMNRKPPKSRKGSNNLHSMQIFSQRHLFQKVLHLKIRYYSSWSGDFIRQLSSVIVLSHIQKLTSFDENPENLYPNTSLTFIYLLQRLPNLHSLIISEKWPRKRRMNDMNKFCSIVPHGLKHLDIDIQSINDVEIILERLEHLSSVVFRYIGNKTNWQTVLMEWLAERRDAKYCLEDNILHIWLGKKKNQYI